MALKVTLGSGPDPLKSDIEFSLTLSYWVTFLVCVTIYGDGRLISPSHKKYYSRTAII